jgi:hypothetical protein
MDQLWRGSGGKISAMVCVSQVKGRSGKAVGDRVGKLRGFVWPLHLVSRPPTSNQSDLW